MNREPLPHYEFTTPREKEYFRMGREDALNNCVDECKPEIKTARDRNAYKNGVGSVMEPPKDATEEEIAKNEVAVERILEGDGAIDISKAGKTKEKSVSKPQYNSYNAKKEQFDKYKKH